MAELATDQKRPRTPRKNPTPRKRPHDYDVTALYSSPEDGDHSHGKPKSQSTRPSRTSPRKRKPKPSSSSTSTFTPKKLFGTSPEAQQPSQRESGNETEGSNQGSSISKKSKKKRSKREIKKVKEYIAEYEELIAKARQQQKEEGNNTAEVEGGQGDASDTVVSNAAERIISSPQETVLLTQEKVSSTQETVLFTQETLSLTQNTLLLPQETVSSTQETVVLTQEPGSLTQETESLTQETELLTQETVSLTQKTSLTQGTVSLTQATALLPQEAVSSTQETVVLSKESGSLTQGTGSLTQCTEVLTQEAVPLTQQTTSLTEETVPLTQATALLPQATASSTQETMVFTQETNRANTEVGSTAHVYIVVGEQNVSETNTDMASSATGVLECKYAITSPHDDPQRDKEGTGMNTGAQVIDTSVQIETEFSEKEQVKSPRSTTLCRTEGDKVPNESDQVPRTHISSGEETPRSLAPVLDISQGSNMKDESNPLCARVESGARDETHSVPLPEETVETKESDIAKETEKTISASRAPNADSLEKTETSIKDVDDKSEPSSTKSGIHKGRRGQSKDNSPLVNSIIAGVRASLVKNMMKTDNDLPKTDIDPSKDSKEKEKQRPNRSRLKLKKIREVLKKSPVTTEKSPTASSSKVTASSSATQARMSWKSPGAPSTPKQPQSVCTTRILSRSVEKVKRRVMFSPDKAPRVLKPNPSSSKGRLPKARAGIFPAGNGEVSWVDEDIVPLIPDDEDQSEDINKLHTPTRTGDGPSEGKNMGDKNLENKEKLVRSSRRLAIKRETKIEAKQPKKATKNTSKKPRGKQKTASDVVSAKKTLPKLEENIAVLSEDDRLVPESRGTKRKSRAKTKNSDDGPQAKRKKGTKKSETETSGLETVSVGFTDTQEAVAGPSDLEKSLNDTPVKDDGSLSKGYELHLSDSDSQTKTIEELSMILLSLSQEPPPKASPLTTPGDSPVKKKSTPKIRTTPKKPPLRTPLKVNFRFRTPTKTPPRATQTSPARFVGRFSEQVRTSELSFQEADAASSLPLPPKVGRLTCSAIEVLDTQADDEPPSTATEAENSPAATTTSNTQKKSTRRTFSVGRKLSRPSVKKKATQIARKYRAKRQESGWVQAVPDAEASTSQTSFPDAQDSPGNRLKIVEVDDDDEWEDEELDENLDEKAQAQNIRLTATNVKTIIREVITNEQVQDMVRNTLLEEEGLKEDFKEAIFQPRVTRAKIKEAVEKGGLPNTWPLTPVKGAPPTPTPKTFTDLELPDEEEEDDDDYDPLAEVLDESDVDSESVVSSHASDFGSPRSQLSKTPTPRKSGLQPHAFFMRDNSQSSMSDVEPPLAERLRSRMSLTDTPLEAIEANFVQTDRTPDLYDTIDFTTSGDRDWQTFLCQVHTTTHSEMNDTYDEKNDPEYNFQAETEQEPEDSEEKRNDKAVRITKKEITALMEELFDAYQDTVEDDTKDDMPENQLVSEMRRLSGQLKTASPSKQSYKPKVPPMKMDTPGAVLVVGGMKELIEETDVLDNTTESDSGGTSPVRQVPTPTAEELIQLQDQMRKHVQLLAQSFVLSSHSDNYADQGVQAANLLEELKMLGERQVQTKGTGSFFLPVNLHGACDIARKGLPTGPYSDRLQAKVWTRLQEKGWKRSLGPAADFALHWTMMEVFVSSPVFLFPQMLPEIRFYERAKASQFQIFTEAEDNLVAMGLVQFEKCGKMTKRYELISQYMMPTMTPTRIQLRIKRLRSKCSPDNIIRTLRDEKKLPEFERYLELEELDSICAPEDRDPGLMPTWYKHYERVKTEMFKNGQCRLLEYDLSSTRCSTPDSFSDTASDCTEERDARRSSLKIPGQKRKTVSRAQEKKQTPDAAFSQSTTPLPNPMDVSPNPATPILPVTQYVILTNESTPVQMSTASTDNSPPPSNPVIIMSTTELQRYGAQMIDTVAPSASDNPALPPASQAGLCSASEQSRDGPTESHRDSVQEAGGGAQQGPDTQTTQTQRPPVMSMPTLQDLEKQVPADVVESAVDMDTVDANVNISDQAERAAVSDAPPTVVQQTEPTVINIQRMTEWHISEKTKTRDTLSSPAHHVVICSPAACSKVQVVHNVVGSPLAQVGTPLTHDSPPAGQPISKDGSELDKTLNEEDQAKQPMQLGSPVVVSQEDQFKIPGVEPLDGVSPIRMVKPMGSLVSASPIAVPEIKTKDVISDQQTTDVSVTNIAADLELAPDVPMDEASSADTTPLKTKQAEDSPSKLLSPANLLLVGGNKIDNAVNLDVCDLQLEADHQSFNDSVEKSCEDTDTSMYVINTPQKFVPNEETSCSPTVYSDRSYSNSPGFSDNTPPRNLNTPTKCAVEIMAAYAQYMTTPPQKKTPHKPSNLVACSTPSPRKRFTPSKLFLSPPNRTLQTTPTRFRKISPNPGAQTPPRVLSPIPKKHNKSPRRKILQQQARAILPKGFVASTFSVSPTKKAAANLKKRARTRSGYRKILPKALDLTGGEPLPTGDENEDTDIDVVETDFASEYDTLDSEFASEDNQSADEKENDAKALSPKPEAVPPPKAKRQRRYRKKKEKKTVEDNESGSEDDGFGFTLRVGAESQDEAEEGDPFAQFMAASTTIRFDPKSRAVLDRQTSKSKAKAKREMTLHMLAPDLVGGDVMRDERDTAFAQAYLERVKHALKDNKDTLEAFLKLLYDFGQSEKTPVELHAEVEKLLVDHPEVMADFSGFLLPDQAQQCGCFVTNLEFSRARSFLRKIETFFSKHPSHLQKILKAFATWKGNADELKNQVLPLLRGQQHLVDQFTSLFATDKPTNDNADDFEEVHMQEDNDSNELPTPETSMEEISLPEASEDALYGTGRCRCQCHNATDKQYSRRKNHCHSCSMKIIQGKLYMQTMEKTLRPVQVQFLGSVPKSKSQQAQTAEEEAQKEDALSSDEDAIHDPLLDATNNQQPPKKYKAVRKRVRASKPKLKVKLPEPKQQVEALPKESQIVRLEHSEPSSPINVTQDSLQTPQSATVGTSEQTAVPTDFSIFRSEIQGSLNTESAPLSQLEPTPAAEVFTDQTYINQGTSAITSTGSPFKIIVESTMTGATGMSHSAPRMRIASKDIRMTQVNSDHDSSNSPSPSSNSNSNSQTNSMSNDVVPDANSNSSNLAVTEDNQCGDQSAHVLSAPPVDDESANMVCHTDDVPPTKSNEQIVMRINLNTQSSIHPQTESSDRPKQTDLGVSQVTGFNRKDIGNTQDESCDVPSRPLPQPFLCDDATMGFNVSMGEKNETEARCDNINRETDKSETSFVSSTAQPHNLQGQEEGVLVQGEACHMDSVKEQEGSGPSSCKPVTEQVPAENEQPAFRGLLQQTLTEPCSEVAKEAPASKTDWTMDEDKEILVTCKEFGPTPEAFISISQKLASHPSPEQVEQRFTVLMQLFEADQDGATSSEDDEDA